MERRLTALIAEPEFFAMKELKMILAELDVFTCGAAATEDDAVAQALFYRPDLVMADVELRKGDGINAVKRIAAAHRPHVIFIADAWASINPGLRVDQCVRKPLDNRAVGECIRLALRRPTASDG